MGRVGRKASLAALARAYEGGVNYFDVARSYGYGRAEGVLGEFLQGRRDQCIVTTKMGIQPSLPSYASRFVLPMLRFAASRLSGLQSLSARRGERLSGVSGGHFEVPNLRASVETSLSELATDYVDILLLHEVAAEDLKRDEILRLLQDVVSEGKARAIGLATSSAESLRILKDSASVDVVQVPNSIWEPCPQALVEGAGFLLTHSAMAVDESGREALRTALERSPELAEDLREAGFLGSDSTWGIPEILLAWALASNPNGITLCGMLKPQHVASNLSTLVRVTRGSQALLDLGRAVASSRLERA